MSKGELHYCAAVEGYFDDKKHYEDIRCAIRTVVSLAADVERLSQLPVRLHTPRHGCGQCKDLLLSAGIEEAH